MKSAHEDLLRYISELEAAVAADVMEASIIARVRLQLSKASSQRRRIVAEAIQRLSEKATPDEARRLDLLRSDEAAILAATSGHVGQWSIESILANPEGYRVASDAMRRSMRERIATEKGVLYPLLEQAGRNGN